MSAGADQLRQWFALAQQQHQRGDLAAARLSYQNILKRYPDHAASLHYLGMVAFATGHPDEAENLLRRSLELNAGNPAWYSNYGLVQLALQRYDDVVLSQQRALQLQPDYAEPLVNLSAALFWQGKFVESAAAARRAAELQPGHAQAWDNLGSALRRGHDLTGSLAAHHQAIHLVPDNPVYRVHLAVALFELKRLDAVIAACQAALERDPDQALALLYWGMALQESGDLKQAETRMLHASRLLPEDDLIRWNLARLQLGMGNLADGWAGYETRWKLEHVLPVRLFHFPWPWWQGHNHPEQTLFIWWEQGIGDQIMFSGLLNDLQGRFRQCVLACPPKLHDLFARSFPFLQVIRNDDQGALDSWSAQIDLQSPIGSLARWLRPAVSSFPRASQFLHADPASVASWRARLAQLGPGKKVGINWRSSNISGGRKLYCTEIGQWREILAVPGVEFINLQYDECSAELELARQSLGVTIHAFPEVDLLDDLDAAAALTAALDLVIAIPTTSAILAAALGVPTWMLFSGFEWQTFGTGENLWYGRQNRMVWHAWNQEWEPLLAALAGDLLNGPASSRLGHKVSDSAAALPGFSSPRIVVSTKNPKMPKADLKGFSPFIPGFEAIKNFSLLSKGEKPEIS